MTTGPATAQELSDDLVLAMRHLQPLLSAMLALLQNADRAAETKIDALTAVMERIATTLENTNAHLAPLGRRMDAQEAALQGLSDQVVAMSHRLGQQDRGRAELQERIGELLTVLRD